MQNASETADYEFDVAGRRSIEWAESADFCIRDSYYWGASSAPIAYERERSTSSGAAMDVACVSRRRSRSFVAGAPQDDMVRGSDAGWER